VVDGAEAFGERGDARLVGQVDGLGRDRRVVVADRERLGIAPGDHHGGTGLPHGVGGGPGDPAAAADDQHGPVLERHGLLPRLA
jgi:hypothetical protein